MAATVSTASPGSVTSPAAAPTVVEPATGVMAAVGSGSAEAAAGAAAVGAVAASATAGTDPATADGDGVGPPAATPVPEPAATTATAATTSTDATTPAAAAAAAAGLAAVVPPAKAATPTPTPTPLPWSDPKSNAGVGPGITILGPVVAAEPAVAAPLLWAPDPDEAQPDAEEPALPAEGAQAGQGAAPAHGAEATQVAEGGATIDPGPLKIVTLEDLQIAERQAKADADLSALIAPRNEGVGASGIAEGSPSGSGSTGGADADYRDNDG